MTYCSFILDVDLYTKFRYLKREIRNTNGIFKAKGNQQLLTNSGEQQGQDKNNTDTTLKTKNK